jgi:branched-chain amino acid transport system ATP-binding protein
MTEALLELDEVTLAFGGLNAVHNLDLTINRGEIVSVIGPNGAGKTTVFNLITGVYEPTAGDIRFAGQSITGLAPHRISRLGIARTFQSLRLFLNMTVKENRWHCRSPTAATCSPRARSSSPAARPRCCRART